MKILLLADPNSVHTIKWAISLAQEGMEVAIFGLGDLNARDYDGLEHIKIQTLERTIDRDQGAIGKLKYLKALPMVKKMIREFQPDIVHAHFASSYGLIGALCGFSPLIVSVWGSDVFSFPSKSWLHKLILEYNLKRADRILSTSWAMAEETKHYTDKEIGVIPFGIDTQRFRPMQVEGLFDKDDLVIGTIKSLEEVYGIEYLIKAFKIVYDKYPQLPLRLLIVGGGSLEGELKKLAKDLGIADQTLFTGKVPYEEVPRYHNMLSIFVSVSNSESFGVAVIEASSCERPVIVSNVGGLPEVVEEGVSGLVVPPRDPIKTAKAIERVVMDETLRKEMGKRGRQRVQKFYQWEDNVNQMIDLYRSCVK
ncbi:MAG: glycosyltransferase [Campylobacterales bacterium]|nr:glycosyltransferase [Campylobacterales bacterium]